MKKCKILPIILVMNSALLCSCNSSSKYYDKAAAKKEVNFSEFNKKLVEQCNLFEEYEYFKNFLDVWTPDTPYPDSDAVYTFEQYSEETYNYSSPVKKADKKTRFTQFIQKLDISSEIVKVTEKTENIDNSKRNKGSGKLKDNSVSYVRPHGDNRSTIYDKKTKTYTDYHTNMYDFFYFEHGSSTPAILVSQFISYSFILNTENENYHYSYDKNTFTVSYEQQYDVNGTRSYIYQIYVSSNKLSIYGSSVFKNSVNDESGVAYEYNATGYSYTCLEFKKANVAKINTAKYTNMISSL